MTKINMEELLADREAGTDGPWRIGKNLLIEGFDPESVSQPWIVADISMGAGYGQCHDPFNASRIARLPDLEAAYIEAVELLREAALQLSDTLDGAYPMHPAREVEREIGKFLEQSA